MFKVSVQAHYLPLYFKFLENTISQSDLEIQSQFVYIYIIFIQSQKFPKQFFPRLNCKNILSCTYIHFIFNYKTNVSISYT